MLTSSSSPLDSFADILRPAQEYFLSNVQLIIPNSEVAIFKATLNGPEGAPVWVRAWLSNGAGTLAEAASPQLISGEDITLQVTSQGPESPQTAYMRIESAPLKTEHVVALKLP